MDKIYNKAMALLAKIGEDPNLDLEDDKDRDMVYELIGIVNGIDEADDASVRFGRGRSMNGYGTYTYDSGRSRWGGMGMSGSRRGGSRRSSGDEMMDHLYAMEQSATDTRQLQMIRQFREQMERM